LKPGISSNIKKFEPFVQYKIANQTKETPFASNPGDESPQWDFDTEISKVEPQPNLMLVYRLLNKSENRGYLLIGSGALRFEDMLTQGKGKGAFDIEGRKGEVLGKLYMKFSCSEKDGNSTPNRRTPRASIVIDSPQRVKTPPRSNKASEEKKPISPFNNIQVKPTEQKSKVSEEKNLKKKPVVADRGIDFSAPKKEKPPSVLSSSFLKPKKASKSHKKFKTLFDNFRAPLPRNYTPGHQKKSNNKKTFNKSYTRTDLHSSQISNTSSKLSKSQISLKGINFRNPPAPKPRRRSTRQKQTTNYFKFKKRSDFDSVSINSTTSSQVSIDSKKGRQYRGYLDLQKSQKLRLRNPVIKRAIQPNVNRFSYDGNMRLMNRVTYERRNFAARENNGYQGSAARGREMARDREKLRKSILEIPGCFC
jgi:hypothetical protein